MAKPWEKYSAAPVAQSAIAPAAANPKPWEKYAADAGRVPTEDVPIVDEAGRILDFPEYPKNPETSMGEDILGAGEAALAVGTGLTGGSVGMIGGTIRGILDEFASGKFGSDEAADRIERAATEGGAALTYEPRTQSGRQQVQAIGEAMAPLAALGPMVAETAAISQGLGAVAPIARGYAQGAVDRVRGSSPVPAARVEPSLGAMGAAPAAAQTSEGLAKAVVESTKAPSRKKIPTMERLASEVMPDETILQAAERLGLKDQLIPSQYSRSQAYRELEQGLASIPSSQLNAQQKQAASMLAQKADDLIQQYGGDIDKAALSADFKSRGLSMIDDLAKQSDELYRKVGEAVPPATKVNAPNAIEVLRNKADELGGPEYLTPVERRVLSGISAEPTYARLDLIRKQIGEGLRGRGPFKDSESGSLKRLYGALSDDQQVAAEALGAGEMFSAAKQLVASRKAIEDDLASVLGKDLSGAITAKTGSAIKSLSSGNYKEFDRVMASIPKDMQQRVVMTSLNDAFTAGSRMEKQLSAPGFVDWYEGLRRNSAAKARLDKYMPKEARATLDDIAKVAKGMRDASKERITTGRINALMENFAQDGGLLSKLYGFGKQAAAAEGVSTSVGLPGAGTAGVLARVMTKEKTPIMQAADDLLSSQQFKNALSEFARAENSPKKAAIAEKTLTNSPSYKKWFSTLDKTTQSAVKANGALNWLSQPVREDSEENPKK